jgi:hypothetical protein
MTVHVRRSLARGCLAVGLTLPGVAFADVPPPEGYVEACTVAKKQTEAVECLACSADGFESTRCRTLLQPYCYVKFCKTRGFNVWGEVWCRTKSGSAPKVPSDISYQLSMTLEPMIANAGASGAASCPKTPAPAEDSTGRASSGGAKGSSSGCSVGPSTLRAAGSWGALVSLLGLAAIWSRCRVRG